MSEYKLTYFNGRGRAEITRLIFAVAGQKYTDERITDWPNGKDNAPLGQLPYLTVDGVKLPQSLSIARFVAKRFNLAGADELEQAKVDAIVDTIFDLVSGYYTKVFYIKDEKEKAETQKNFFANEAPQHLGKIEKLIGMYGSNGFSVGNSLKWSDLYLWDITSFIHQLDSSLVGNYPAIVAVRKSVEANEKVAEYVKNRPQTAF